MKIAYVLASIEISGGVKVVFQHAALLHQLGHEVTIFGEGPAPGWISFPGRYVDLFALPRLSTQDLVIATYYTTVAVAEWLGIGPLAHLCQGYEGDLHHLVPERVSIEAVYRRALPTFVVAPHLAEALAARFGRLSVVTPPPLDPRFQPAWRLCPGRRPCVLVPGVFEARVKGLATALAAVQRLRAQGTPCRLLRVSALPQSAAEAAIATADRYLHAVSPALAAVALRGCDLVLAPSLPMEGFGLPLLEAMASGVPAVGSDIPASRYVTGGAVPLVPAGDAEALADAARSLLASPLRWQRARRAGLRAARRFHPDEVRPALARAVAWAAGA